MISPWRQCSDGKAAFKGVKEEHPELLEELLMQDQP
jgi:hypothetical protein